MADKYECVNCGNDFSVNEERCKYCGTPNPYYVPPKKNVSAPLITPNDSRWPTSEEVEAGKKKTYQSFLIFGIVALFIFPPIGLVMIIVGAVGLAKCGKKNGEK